VITSQINKFLSLPELKFTAKKNITNHIIQIEAYKFSEFEVCPKCATKSDKVYDHVYINIKDSPIRDKSVFLRIKKRRFLCPSCKSVREPVPGIIKGFRTTQRFRAHIRWCASNFSDESFDSSFHCQPSSPVILKLFRLLVWRSLPAHLSSPVHR
jgi:transposase